MKKGRSGVHFWTAVASAARHRFFTKRGRIFYRRGPFQKRRRRSALPAQSTMIPACPGPATSVNFVNSVGFPQDVRAAVKEPDGEENPSGPLLFNPSVSL